MTSGTFKALPLASPVLAEPRPPRAEETLRGNLAVVSPIDLLQWLCSNRQIWSVRFFGTELDAEVVVIDGQLVDARWGDLHGMPALCEIVGCRRGSFELAPVSGAAERTLSGSWQNLVLSAVQSLDEREAQRHGQHVDVERHLSALRPENAGMVPETATADMLIDRGFVALREGRLDEARLSWSRALQLDPENRSLAFNLRKLDDNASHRGR